MVKETYEIIEHNELYQVIKMTKANGLINHYYLEKINYGNLYFMIGDAKKNGELFSYETYKKTIEKANLGTTTKLEFEIWKHDFIEDYIQMAEEEKFWKW